MDEDASKENWNSVITLNTAYHLLAWLLAPLEDKEWEIVKKIQNFFC